MPQDAPSKGDRDTFYDIKTLLTDEKDARPDARPLPNPCLRLVRPEPSFASAEPVA